MPISNRMQYHFNCQNIDRDFIIYKIITDDSSQLTGEKAGKARRKAADILVNAGLPIRSAVYSSAMIYSPEVHHKTLGVYLLVDRNEISRDQMMTAFEELCSGLGVCLTMYAHSNILTLSNGQGDPNGLANLLLYYHANQMGYSNVNGVLYYAVDILRADGTPKDYIKMIRLRFMGNGVLSGHAETWKKPKKKEEETNIVYGLVPIDTTCRFKTLTSNMHDKTLNRYIKKGISGHRAQVPYLGFAKNGSKRFDHSICGAIWQALKAVNDDGRYLKLTPVVYNNCKSIKDKSISRYSLTGKNKSKKAVAFNDTWKSLLSDTSVCICAGAPLSDDEKKKASSILSKLTDALKMNGSASVTINLDQTLADAIREDSSRYFIPIIHEKLKQSDWEKIIKTVSEEQKLPQANHSSLEKVWPAFDDHYRLLQHAPELLDVAKYRIQYFTINKLLEQEKVIPVLAKRIRCELLIKHDLEQKRLSVFDWPGMDEKHAITCVSRQKIVITSDRKTKNYYNKFLYAVMRIQPDGTFSCRCFMESIDDSREIEEQSKGCEEENEKIVEAFHREEEKLLNTYEYLSSRDIVALYIYHNTPDDGFLIEDAPEKILPNLRLLSQDLQKFENLTEEKMDQLYQEHLAASWIAGHSKIAPETFLEKIQNAYFPLDYESLFELAEVEDRPEFQWHLAKETMPTVYAPKKDDTSEDIKKGQEAIDRMLAPYSFSFASAKNVCKAVKEYRDHADEQEANDQMCKELFGIRYLGENRRFKGPTVKRLDQQCDGLLSTKWKSNEAYGIKPMTQNFYRATTPETEPFLPDAGIAMYYCGRFNLQKDAVATGRYWRYVVPANEQPVSEETMTNIMKTMNTDLVTSDDSRTVYPFMLKYLREYAIFYEAQYRYRIAAKLAVNLSDAVKDAIQQKYTESCTLQDERPLKKEDE